MPTAISTTTDELTEIVQTVFQTMMRLKAEPALDVPLPQSPMVTAAVCLTGIVQGAVLLHCPPWQACGLAGEFMKRTPPSTVDDDVLDVIGELANMIAGNLKCTFLPGTQLSIPSVTQGADSAPRLCGTRPVQRTAFRTPLGPIWVTMYSNQSMR
ncbi:MAG: hypothetical protein RL328_1823 [Acidobacteriota bacterium]|jgi:chemotaxis protein CheX